MKSYNAILRQTLALFTIGVVFLLPVATLAQTKVSLRKNKYKIEDDIKLGREASAEAEKVYPILRDEVSEAYISNVGEKLVQNIPSEFQHPGFRYTFKLINARDINAFSLPGGPSYINRGLIEAAKNEGELAGVMSHEICHAALRHATAQATQQSKPINQIGTIGGVLGGLILGTIVGGEAGQVIAQTAQAGTFALFVAPYSREMESEADICGSQVMARAGYDPRDLANMFRTIANSGGGSPPEWLSTHPNPKNREARINQEAALLRVSPNAIRDTRDFQRIKSRLQSMPKAKSMEEIERDRKTQGGGTGTGTSGGRYGNVQSPSGRYRTYNGGFMKMDVPDNWKEFATEQEVTFAPDGAYGDDGITHGAMIGIYPNNSGDLSQATDSYLNELLNGNKYLQKQGGTARGTVSGGRAALKSVLAGRSPVTGQTEVVTVYTTQLSDRNVFYLITVSPQSDSATYNRAFNTMLRSLQISDR